MQTEFALPHDPLGQRYYGISTCFFALLLVAVGLLWPSEAFSRSPAPPVCGGSETSQKGKEREAVNRAQRVFPSVEFKVRSLGCRHFGFSLREPMQVPFQPFVLNDPATQVTFQVREPMGQFHGPSHESFLLLPFPSQVAMAEIARSIREVPMVKHAFGSRPLTCGVDLDAPGSTAYFACTPLGAPRSAITLEVARHPPVVKLRQATGNPSYSRRNLLDGLFDRNPRSKPGARSEKPRARDEKAGARGEKPRARDRMAGARGGKLSSDMDPKDPSPAEPTKPEQAEPLAVHEYSLPWVWLHPETRAWTEIRMTPEVLAFLALQPAAIVTLQTWHQDYLTIRAPLAPSHNLVVVWDVAYRRGQIAQVVHACRDTKPMDCVHKARDK